MDGSGFDRLAKQLAGVRSRRSTLAGVLSGVLVPLGLADADAAPDQVGADACLADGRICGGRLRGGAEQEPVPLVRSLL